MDFCFLNCVVMGDNYQFVIGWYVVIFDVYYYWCFVLQFQFLCFYIMIVVDNCVYLVGQQGVGQLEIDVYQFDVGWIDFCMLCYGCQGGLFNVVD